MIDFSTPVKNLTSVGQTTAGRLQKIGIKSANDLLWYFPRAYEDLSAIVPIVKIEPGHKVCLKAKVEMIQTRRSPRKRMYITEALASDKTGKIKIIWFNQPYLSKNIQPGNEFYFAGEVSPNNLLKMQLSNPTYEKISSNPTHTARIIPLYPLTYGLTQKQIRFLIKQALPLTNQIQDYLPDSIKQKYKLADLPQALRSIHFPDKLSDFQKAQTRLKFDELLLIMLGISLSKERIKSARAEKIEFKEKIIKKFVQELPFALTDGQKKAGWEILQDLAKSKPMNRLLEGDVGSGKTVVAGLAILNTINQNFQTVLMAPTEILARQHFDTFANLFSQHQIDFALFTRTDKQISQFFPFDKRRSCSCPSDKNEPCSCPPNKGGEREVFKTTKKELLKKITKGDIKFIIGTHALLQDKVEFDNLALLVIDEQHRFGVEQRQKLKDKTPDKLPHFLSMTATPIPRSLALTLYGDLDISLLKEKPANRKPIITRLINNNSRAEAYDFIKKEINKNKQVFVICPLIDESDKLGVKSATQEYENLKNNIFSKYKIGLVHGKLKKDEKANVMKEFAKGKIDILVATAVVEVGVDIPKATIIMIEGADRFGLAQLHQFRGRVGRSDKQSYCLLFTDSRNPQTLERLKTLVKTNNGFQLAEQDLKFRGPGDIYGYKQSGLPEMKIASLNDLELMKQTKETAEQIISSDPELKNQPLLLAKLKTSLKTIHLE